VFIESTDGVNYKSGGAINFNDYLKNHTNVWLSVDSFPEYPLESIANDTSSHAITKGVGIYTNPSVAASMFFNIPVLPQISGVTYYNLFNDVKFPILIKEYADQAYVIITHNSFFNSIDINVKALYEIMMYVFFNSYLETDDINEWIADQMPNYIVSNGNVQ
jgi:hypothetical protein